MKFLRIVTIVVGFLIAAYFVLFYIAINDGTPVDAAYHFLAGWFYFLKRNFEALAFDTAIFIMA